MTPDQVQLVQTTFALVEPIADEAAALFYGRLFELAPDVRALFPEDMAEQRTALMRTLAAVVKGLDAPDQIVPAVQRLGARHAGYGAEPGHYPVVGEALLWTLAQGLGEAFTPEVAAAWTAAYELLATTMIHAAGEAA
jgi:nitric oxide dioxygenase